MRQIAVIGSGIAGLTSAYYLSRRYAVTVFEANDYIGGHTHTVDVALEGQKSAIDTGFIVFNDRTYPNFIRLLDELRVAYQPTEMSFSVRNDAIDLEYNGNNLNGLFAQRANLLRPAFWRMLLDIVRFNREVRREAVHPTARTIGEYLDRRHFGALFTDNYLLPMIAAIWSMGLQDARAFPLQFFVRFFENHGLLNLVNRPQWYTIVGGSRAYIGPLSAPFRKSVRLNTPVTRIERINGRVKLTSSAGAKVFDEVVVACHGDQALALLSGPSEAERTVLGALDCTENRVVLHTDTRRLPRRKSAWASWNYRRTAGDAGRATLTYNMNILQRLKKRPTFLVSLNQDIAADKVLGRFTYAHPMFNPAAIKAQRQWPTISGIDHVHYCGAYWFNGFHEDGVRSGLRVCRSLGVAP
ncbi:MAG: FAD-dependent oxidoreductase [Desulfobacterales bacterium]